jgi:hypothetical protein
MFIKLSLAYSYLKWAGINMWDRLKPLTMVVTALFIFLFTKQRKGLLLWNFPINILLIGGGWDPFSDLPQDPASFMIFSDPNISIIFTATSFIVLFVISLRHWGPDAAKVFFGAATYAFIMFIFFGFITPVPQPAENISATPAEVSCFAKAKATLASYIHPIQAFCAKHPWLLTWAPNRDVFSWPYQRFVQMLGVGSGYGGSCKTSTSARKAVHVSNPGPMILLGVGFWILSGYYWLHYDS